MIKFKKRHATTICILISIAFTSCNNDDDSKNGNWINRSAFDGPARSSTVSFVIDNLAYVTTGYTGEEDGYLKDLWVYNPNGDFWEQKQDFMGIGRSSASGFELNGKGYVGLGYDGTNRLKDFYQYDPLTDTWSQKEDFGGTARYGAIGFQVGGKAYMGTGYDGNYLKDIYQYIPGSTDADPGTWVTNTGYGGNKRRYATVFIIDDKAYLGTGINNNVYELDFWEFNPTTEVWTKKRPLDYKDSYNIERSNASGFAMNGHGYIACGVNSGTVNTVWQYDPIKDTWDERTSYEGNVRYDATAFSIQDRGYVLLGRTGSSFFEDLWEFMPFEKYEDED